MHQYLLNQFFSLVGMYVISALQLVNGKYSLYKLLESS